MSKIWRFFAPILKPYTWYYVLMFQIPFVAVAFHVLNGYALKLIVDTATHDQSLTKWEIIYPILIFVAFSSINFRQHCLCKAKCKA